MPISTRWTSTPAWARRRAATEPPYPVPITSAGTRAPEGIARAGAACTPRAAAPSREPVPAMKPRRETLF
ncbi:hypothetical protein ACFQYP_26860 [Nonomuraea antimicrobica]